MVVHPVSNMIIKIIFQDTLEVSDDNNVQKKKKKNQEEQCLTFKSEVKIRKAEVRIVNSGSI